MSTEDIVIGVALEEPALTVEQLALACGVESDWVLRHIQEGCFPPMEGSVAEWRFTTTAVVRARRIRELERDFDAVPELAALVADLLEELDRLRAQVRRSP